MGSSRECLEDISHLNLRFCLPIECLVPQTRHMRRGDNGIPLSTQEQNRRPTTDLVYLRSRIPPLVDQECEISDNGDLLNDGWYREEGVLQDHCVDLE